MTPRSLPPDHPVVELFRDLRNELDRMGVDAVRSLRPPRDDIRRVLRAARELIVALECLLDNAEEPAAAQSEKEGTEPDNDGFQTIPLA